MIELDALILSLPARNSTIRMRVWRALKETGCGVLRDGVYVLPAGSASAPVLAQMAAEVEAADGVAMTVEMKLTAAGQVETVRKLFDRSAGYGALVQSMSEVRSGLRKLGSRKAQTAITRLQRAFEKLAAIDFFPGQGKQQAAEALAALKLGFREEHAGGEPRTSKKRLRRIDSARYKKRVWATRKDLWVDRLASAWLIKRFIDRDAKFIWLDRPRDCPKQAVGFDFDGAKFTHVANRVTFEVLVLSFGLDQDRSLAAIGAAVHFLDVGGIPVADAKGLETVLRGAKEKARGDDAALAEAMRILDLFYSAYARKPDA